MPTSPSSSAWASNPKSVAGALAYASGQAKSHNPIWYRRCLAFVARAYGLPGSGTSYAIDIWSQMPVSMRHTGSANIPTGALLLYRTGSRAGHIALYAGSGMVYSNDIKGNGKIALVKFSDLVGGIWNLNYVGWTPPYFPHSPLSHIAGSISEQPSTTPPGSSESPTEAPTGSPDALAGALGWASDPKHWYNLLYIAIGILLILLALTRMTRKSLQDVVTKVGSITPSKPVVPKPGVPNAVS
jgi:hypothetical protein